CSPLQLQPPSITHVWVHWLKNTSQAHRASPHVNAPRSSGLLGTLLAPHWVHAMNYTNASTWVLWAVLVAWTIAKPRGKAKPEPTKNSLTTCTSAKPRRMFQLRCQPKK